MRKFRKRTETISASQWFFPGDHTGVREWRYPRVDPETGEITADKDTGILMGNLRHSDAPPAFRRPGCHTLLNEHGYLETLDGGKTVCPGDWIIKSPSKALYSYKPDLFKKLYEEVTDERPLSPVERELIKKAYNAWVVEGINPDYHRRVKLQARRLMPVLAEALDQLEQYRRGETL